MEVDNDLGSVNLGYVESDYDAAHLSSHHFFPNGKVGGRPMWLSMSPLPSAADVTCGKCGGPLSFLLQAYAPVDDGPPTCFHRSLYVFLCRKPGCGDFRVLRSQLPRDNPFYAFDPIAAEDLPAQKQVSDFGTLCFICGNPGSKKCGRCSLAWYCSREHQAAHWKAGHKGECSAEAPVAPAALAASPPDTLFPQFLLAIEPEELPPDFDPQAAVMDDCEDEEDADPAEAKDEDLLMAASRADPFFDCFRQRVAENPDQVIRYERHGSPLWASKTLPNEKAGTSVPPCGICGAERSFEFQIMPELLTHLGVDDVGASIDWATVVVFTCRQSCEIPSSGYATEFAFKQDFE